MNTLSCLLLHLLFAIALISCSRVPIDGNGEPEPFDATPPERTTLSKGRSHILKLTEEGDVRLSTPRTKIPFAPDAALEKGAERTESEHPLEEEEFKELGNLLNKRKSRSTLALINPNYEKKDD